MDCPQYLLLGNITADIAPDSRTLGGTVSYSALTAAAFEIAVGLVTSAAAGEPLLRLLADVVSLHVKEAAETTTFENIYTPTGRIQYIRGIAAPIEPADIPQAWLAAPLVHLAPIAAETDPQLARHFPNSTVLLTLQGCLRQWGEDGRVHFRRWFDRDVLQHINIVVFSEEDIAEAPEMEQEYASAVRCLIVTRAERGGSVYVNGQHFEYDTPHVELVHPTGAGDIFATALLAALEHVDGDYVKACRVATRLAALSVTRVALASVPTAAEVRAALSAIA